MFTHTSIPKTDGQTFSLSELNGRLRGILNVLVNIFCFCLQKDKKNQFKIVA